MSTADLAPQGSTPQANIENIMINGKEHEVFDPTRNQMEGVQAFTTRSPFKQGAQVAYFLCQAPDIHHALRLARERSYWGVSGRHAAYVREVVVVPHALCFVFLEQRLLR